MNLGHPTRRCSSRRPQLGSLFHHWRPNMLHRSLLHLLFQLLCNHRRPNLLPRSLLLLEFQLLLWEVTPMMIPATPATLKVEATTTTMEDPENPEDMRPSSLVRAPLAHVPSGWRSPTIRMESEEDLW